MTSATLSKTIKNEKTSNAQILGVPSSEANDFYIIAQEATTICIEFVYEYVYLFPVYTRCVCCFYCTDKKQTQCWVDVGRASQTLAQHRPNTGSMFRGPGSAEGGWGMDATRHLSPGNPQELKRAQIGFVRTSPVLLLLFSLNYLAANLWDPSAFTTITEHRPECETVLNTSSLSGFFCIIYNHIKFSLYEMG